MKWAPALFGLLALALWEAAVRLADVPVYQLPGPIAIAGAFAADPVGLLQALASTLLVTFAALAGRGHPGSGNGLGDVGQPAGAGGDPALGGGACR